MALRPFVLSTAMVVRAPLETVFPFFADPANLEAITPAFLNFTILTPRPIAMRVGARIEYRLRIHGVPVRWDTEITEYDPPHRFVDLQLRGPYKLWRHEHGFRSVPEGTELTDRVELMPPGGPLAPLVFKLFVARDVVKIFRHREAEIAARFGLVRTTAPTVTRGA